jgi:hypothetical protein
MLGWKGYYKWFVLKPVKPNDITVSNHGEILSNTMIISDNLSSSPRGLSYSQGWPKIIFVTNGNKRGDRSM